MQFPLTLADLTLWLAITSAILLATSEIISPQYGRISLLIEKNRLRYVALMMGIFFILAILAQIYLVTPLY